MNQKLIEYHKFKEDISLTDSINFVDGEAYIEIHKNDVIHRHSFFELQFIWDGTGEQHIDFQKYHVDNNFLFFIHPNQVHNASQAILSNFEVVIFNPEYLGFLNGLEILKTNFRLSSQCFKLKKSYADLLKKYLQLLKAEYKNNRDRIIMQGLLFSVLGHAERLFNEQFEQNHYLDSRTIQFIELVEQYYKVEHTANFYANKLNLSVKHLNNLVTKDFGKTASAIIRERITLEIKRLLSYTKISHKEIAYELGFKDPYYMSNFFKHQTGTRPSNFR